MEIEFYEPGSFRVVVKKQAKVSILPPDESCLKKPVQVSTISKLSVIILLMIPVRKYTADYFFVKLTK